MNILTNHAVTNRRIKVFGGTQMRPNIHIDDMVEAYVQSLRWPDEAIDGKIYNVGYENYRLMDIAEMVREGRGAGREHRHHADRRFAVVPRLVGQDPPRTGLRGAALGRGRGARPGWRLSRRARFPTR